MPYGWLGNMSAHPVIWQGKEWRTAEAAFQAMRFDDPAIREELRAIMSPMGVKMRTKKLKHRMTIQPDHSAFVERDLRNMAKVLQLKLDCNPDLVPLLLETGDREIIEDVTARPRGSSLFWGKALVDGAWIGEGHLGRLWAEVRRIRRLRNDTGAALQSLPLGGLSDRSSWP